MSFPPNGWPCTPLPVTSSLKTVQPGSDVHQLSHGLDEGLRDELIASALHARLQRQGLCGAQPLQVCREDASLPGHRFV